MIAIARGLPRFDGRSSFSTWAYRVATNACLDELRRRRRHPEPTDDAALDQAGARATGGGGGGGHLELDRIGERVDIDAALAALAPEFRAAVVLRDLIGLDYAEIGEILEVPVGTVKSRIARGRAALADHLAPGGNRIGATDRPRTRP